GQYPEQLDIFRAADVQPQIMLLLDTSCSMGDTIQQNLICSYYRTSQSLGAVALNKYQQPQAVLTGCDHQSDGLIRTWDNRVNFAIAAFGLNSCPQTNLCGVDLYAEFGSTQNQLEAAAFRMNAIGVTPMTGGLAWAGMHIGSYMNPSTTKQCRPDYVVLMT